MSLRRKPHAVTVQRPADDVEAGVLVGHEMQSQGTVRGQLTPTTPRILFDRFAVEAKRPHLFLCDAGDAGKFAEGGRVTFGSRSFAVVAGPVAYDGFGSADCTEVYLEEIL